MDDRFDDALNDCIDRWLAGESLADCLARYPQWAADLEPLIEVAGMMHQAAARTPSERFKAEARYRFMARLGVRRARQARRWWPGVFGYPRLALPAAAVLLFLSSSFGAVVASAGSLPGDLLYTVKLASEEVQRTLAPDDLARTQLDLALASRRTAEIEELAGRGRLEPLAAERAAHATERAVAAVERTGQPATLNQQLLQITERQQRVLQTIIETRAAEAARPGLERALEASRKGHERAREAIEGTATPTPTAVATRQPGTTPPPEGTPPGRPPRPADTQPPAASPAPRAERPTPQPEATRPAPEAPGRRPTVEPRGDERPAEVTPPGKPPPPAKERPDERSGNDRGQRPDDQGRPEPLPGTTSTPEATPAERAQPHSRPTATPIERTQPRQTPNPTPDRQDRRDEPKRSDEGTPRAGVTPPPAPPPGPAAPTQKPEPTRQPLPTMNPELPRKPEPAVRPSTPEPPGKPEPTRQPLPTVNPEPPRKPEPADQQDRKDEQKRPGESTPSSGVPSPSTPEPARPEPTRDSPPPGKPDPTRKPEAPARQEPPSKLETPGKSGSDRRAESLSSDASGLWAKLW